MSSKNRIAATGLFSVPAAGFNNSFQTLVVTPEACSMFRIINDSSLGVQISYNNTALPDDYVRAGEVFQFSVQPNALPQSGVALLAKNTTIYVKGATAGTGTVYFSGYYQK